MMEESKELPDSARGTFDLDPIKTQTFYILHPDNGQLCITPVPCDLDFSATSGDRQEPTAPDKAYTVQLLPISEDS